MCFGTTTALDTSKTHYLQERHHEKRIVRGNIVKHTGNTERHRYNERYSCPCHYGIKYPYDCLLCQIFLTGYHGEQETNRQEHCEDNKKYLAEQHHARKQEYKYRYP